MVVVISQDIVKQKERIDLAGNVIDPMTKKIIKKVEDPYVPPVQVEKPKEEKGKIEQMIEAKIEAAIEAKIEQVLSKILK